MASDSSAWAAENGFSAMGSHLVKGKEIFGQVNGIQPVDDETVRVQIGQVKLLLPAGLDLPVGGRIFLARTDDHEYGIWIVPEEEHVPPIQAICPAGFTIDEICREIESGNLIAFLKNRLGDRVDLSLVGFPPIATPERLGIPDRSSASTGSDLLSHAVPKPTPKLSGKEATTARPPARAKAGSKRVRA